MAASLIWGGLKKLGSAAKGAKGARPAGGTGGAQDGSQAGSASTGQKLKQGYKNWISQGQQSRRPKVELDLSPQFSKRGVPSMKRGGRVRKTGIYRLHAGETVVRAARKSRSKGTHKRVLVKL
jgi:hypothetical protein